MSALSDIRFDWRDVADPTAAAQAAAYALHYYAPQQVCVGVGGGWLCEVVCKREAGVCMSVCERERKSERERSERERVCCVWAAGGCMS